MKSAVGMAVVVAVAAVFSRGEGHVAPVRPLPGTIATLQPAQALGAVSGGAGDAWVDDRWGERLLRIDHRTGAVIARKRVRGRVAVKEASGSMWVLQSGGGYGRGLRGPLLRIDPATNRTIGVIPLLELGFGLVAHDDDLWVWGPRNLVRIDARAGVAFDAILVDDRRGETTGFGVIGDEPAITTADGHLVRFDPRTGAERSVLSLPFRDPALQTADEDQIVLTSRGSVAAVDPDTGAVRWRTRLGYRVGGVEEADGALWAYGAAVSDPGDRVWKLEPARGTVRGSVLLPAFGTMGMAVIDGTLWVTTANGRVLAFRR
jgi:outer membrane protein assembly factor BamB